MHFAHHLVAAAFLGPRPLGMQINHKNGIKTDNYFTNLEYVTPSQNSWHAYHILKVYKTSFKPGAEHPSAKKHITKLRQ